MKQSDSTAVRLLLGWDTGIGQAVTPDDFWGTRVIKAVGNYGEMFDRDLGQQSPMKMPREPNALWTEGGALYACPFVSSKRLSCCIAPGGNPCPL